MILNMSPGKSDFHRIMWRIYDSWSQEPENIKKTISQLRSEFVELPAKDLYEYAEKLVKKNG